MQSTSPNAPSVSSRPFVVDSQCNFDSKVLREITDTDSVRSSNSPEASKPSASKSLPQRVRDSKSGQGAGDDSDMDMSPPVTPMLQEAVPPPPLKDQPRSIPPTSSAPGKTEVARPSLVINTLVSPELLPHEIPPERPSGSPAPLTSDVGVGGAGGDESDMDMSSPASESPPSPLPAVQDIPALPLSPKRSPRASTPPGLTLANDVARLRVESIPPLSLPSIPEDQAANTPPLRVFTPERSRAREVSVQVSPHLARTAVSRPPVENGELSPPASEETLREETEGIEKDLGSKQVDDLSRGTTKDVPMAVDEPSLDRIVTEIPLSEALRMVARLRYRHDPITQEARIEPILISNRQLVDTEEPPASPEEKSVVEAVAEKEQQQASEGAYEGTKHSLRKRFAQHQAVLAEKVARLRKEYLALHEKWLVHCAKLDEVARNSALEEAAAAACRTTRRTAAMGDAVRTDLEMEQILASLGNEELTDANHLSAKNGADIPDMVSVTRGRVEYIYDDTNNLVEDPHDFYKLETGIDDWTEDERTTMIEHYAKHPKQFGFIADALSNKTPAQCVSFYYLQKNTTIDFRKAVAQFNTIGKRRRSGRKQKGNALLADILKHDDEVSQNAGSSGSGRRKRGAASTPVPTSATTETPDPSKKGGASTSRRGTAQNTPTATPTPDPEPMPKRPRRRANPTARAAAAKEQEPVEEGSVSVISRSLSAVRR